MKKLLILSACALAPLASFAQYLDYERPEPTIFDKMGTPGLLLFLVIVIILTIIITRLIFSIPTFLKYQKIQTMLLIKIAKQEKISNQELDTILDIIEERDAPVARNSDTLRDIYRKTITSSHLDTQNTNS